MVCEDRAFFVSFILFFKVNSLPLQHQRKGNYMQETRQNKIARLLQKELSVIFQEQTRGMHGAHLSIFPSERGEEIMGNINKNEKQIRYELGTRVRHQLRVIPELRFFIDDSLDYIDRIDELLKK